jgi:hypothetical protein
MGGGPAFDMNYADFGPNPIDPFGYDPFAQSDANASSEQGNENTEGFEADAAGAMAGSPNRGFMSRLSKLDRYVRNTPKSIQRRRTSKQFSN